MHHSCLWMAQAKCHLRPLLSAVTCWMTTSLPFLLFSVYSLSTMPLTSFSFQKSAFNWSVTCNALSPYTVLLKETISYLKSRRSYFMWIQGNYNLISHFLMPIFYNYWKFEGWDWAEPGSHLPLSPFLFFISKSKQQFLPFQEWILAQK